MIELTGAKSKIVYEPLPADDPTQRQPDITLAKTKLELGAEGAAARRADEDDRLVPLDRHRRLSPADAELLGVDLLSVLVASGDGEQQRSQ